jgi:hypothetical protein
MALLLDESTAKQDVKRPIYTRRIELPREWGTLPGNFFPLFFSRPASIAPHLTMVSTPVVTARMKFGVMNKMRESPLEAGSSCVFGVLLEDGSSRP